jgi:hypothetical protein
LVLACASCLLSGCLTSSKYKLAKKDVPPAQPLNWSITVPPAELTLETLIVVKGPGSWKYDARWDEYIVRIANHGPQPLEIDSASLVDLLGEPQFPGTDPWKLEKLSYSNWDKYGKAGVTLLAGYGIMGAYAMTTIYVAYTGSLAAADAMVVAMPVLLVADVAGVALIDHSRKGKIQLEFAKRRLALPFTVAPGAMARGSLFFPMTPGPQRLTLKGTAGDAPLELVLQLKPLAGLHLKPAAGK